MEFWYLDAGYWILDVQLDTLDDRFNERHLVPKPNIEHQEYSIEYPVKSNLSSITPYQDSPLRNCAV